MKRRLLVSYLSITAFVLIILEIPLGVAYTNSLERRMTSDLQHDAFSLAIRAQRPLGPDGTPAELAQLDNLADAYRADTGGRVIVVDADGSAVADSHADGTDITRSYVNRPEIAEALDGNQVRGTRHSDTLETDLLYVALPVVSEGGIRGAVRITYPASVVADRVRDTWWLLAATGGVVLGIVFMVSMLLARSMTRPLAALEETARELGDGELSTRAKVPRGPKEVTALATSFNTTAEHLEELVGGQRAFVADASHQLRTPLAALRLRLENLEAEVSGAVAEDLDGALAEVRRLSRLVDGLLVLARTERSTSAPVGVDLEEILTGREESWEAFASEKDVRIDVRHTSGAVALATPGRLEQVIDNLLNNALEVAPSGSVVTMSVRPNGPWYELRVSDEGPGMNPEERARAFDRFWQSGPARRDGRANGHFGLGLAIVRELVVGDGGDIALAAAPGGGLEVVLKLRRGGDRQVTRPRQLSATPG